MTDIVYMIGEGIIVAVICIVPLLFFACVAFIWSRWNGDKKDKKRGVK